MESRNAQTWVRSEKSTVYLEKAARGQNYLNIDCKNECTSNWKMWKILQKPKWGRPQRWMQRGGRPDYLQKLKVPEGYEKMIDYSNIWHGTADGLKLQRGASWGRCSPPRTRQGWPRQYVSEGRRNSRHHAASAWGGTRDANIRMRLVLGCIEAKFCK